MKNRTFDIYIRLTKEDAADLKRKTKMCGITQSALLRILLKGYEPREKPDDRFYDVIRRMCAIGNSLNQIASKASERLLFSVQAITLKEVLKTHPKATNLTIQVKPKKQHLTNF